MPPDASRGTAARRSHEPSSKTGSAPKPSRLGPGTPKGIFSVTLKRSSILALIHLQLSVFAKVVSPIFRGLSCSVFPVVWVEVTQNSRRRFLGQSSVPPSIMLATKLMVGPAAVTQVAPVDSLPSLSLY